MTPSVASTGRFMTPVTQRSPMVRCGRSVVELVETAVVEPPSVVELVETSPVEPRAVVEPVETSPTCARFQAREPSLGMRRPFASPSSAGNRVVATPIAMSTATAAPTPITERNGMPTTSSPSSAMMTVTPAKTTALPAVPTAIAADSSGSSPLAS